MRGRNRFQNACIVNRFPAFEEIKNMYGDRRSGGFGGPREMHDAVCSSCNKQTKVPFKPSGDRPVYCLDCFKAQKNAA